MDKPTRICLVLVSSSHLFPSFPIFSQPFPRFQEEFHLPLDPGEAGRAQQLRREGSLPGHGGGGAAEGGADLLPQRRSGKEGTTAAPVVLRLFFLIRQYGCKISKIRGKIQKIQW